MTKTNKGLGNAIARSIIIDGRVPWQLVAIAALVSVLPFLLSLLGMDFGSHGQAITPAQLLNAANHVGTDAEFASLKGAFVHSILEWSAVLVAFTVAFLSITHYGISRDAATAVIGLAFLITGCMDAFHVLAADRLIDAAADNREFIPFTWAISRSFSALTLMAGIATLMTGKKRMKTAPGMFHFGLTALVFALFAFFVMRVTATANQLPATVFPDTLVNRPYDVVPLLLFAFSGLLVYPRFFRQYPSMFTQALLISAIPQVAAQLHMVFGSTALFDNNFNIAHFLKIFAYQVPLTGLLLEYIRVYRQSEYLQKKLSTTASKLYASDQHMRTILNSVMDGIIVVDTQGLILELNPAALEIFAYEEKELVGKNIKMLVAEPFHSEHDGYLENYHKSGEAKIIGMSREVTGLRSDGSTFPIHLAVSKMHIDGRTLYNGLIHDISDRKAAEKTKSEFISTVSHELRTPLTSIRGALGLVIGGASGELPDKARAMLEVANRNSERLIVMINDLLDLEKLAAGKIEFEFQTLDLVQLVRQSLEANQGYASEHKIQLKLQPGLPLATVTADSYRIQQVLSNLISNAVKFSPQGGVVEVSVSRNDNGEIRTTVRDHGAGIAEEFKSRIFQRFSQADSSDERQKGGTGLGLSISKAIIEDHKGHIDFCAATGGGTEFYFDLPEIAGQATSESLEHRTQPGASVLICEDNADVAQVLSGLLEKEGLICDLAGTATQAKELLFNQHYQLLMLDLGLPDQNGIDLISELRLDNRTSRLPIIVVSASAEEGRRTSIGRATEVIDWVQKPVDENRLRVALERVFDSEANARILHVEDDLDVVQVVTHLLGNLPGYENATTFQAATKKLENTQYDLVIIDIELPDGTGLELLPLINHRSPVIIFSGQDVDLHIRHEVEAFLTKATTSNEQLLTAIRRVIRRAASLQKDGNGGAFGPASSVSSPAPGGRK